MTEIAIAYSSADKERVRPFYDVLKEKHYKVFWDQDLVPGDIWDKEIRIHFDAATCILIFLSENAVKSNHVLHEAQVALSKRNHIPILLEKLTHNDMPSGYSVTQALEVPQSGPDRTMWETLDKGLKKVMKGRPWVQDLIAQELTHYTRPLLDRIDSLQNESDKYKENILDLEEELKKAKKLFANLDKAIDKVQRQSDRLTIGSEAIKESLDALKKYLSDHDD